MQHLGNKAALISHLFRIPFEDHSAILILINSLYVQMAVASNHMGVAKAPVTRYASATRVL